VPSFLTPASCHVRADTLPLVRQVADGVWQINTIPVPNAVNAYVADDVLIDAGTRHSPGLIKRSLQGHRINAHALTHAHPDHQGASHEICESLGIPFWVGDGDADAAENPELIGERQPDHWLARLYHRLFTGPGHPVDRRLVEGNDVAGFRVLETPGHSAGHVVYWRESDRVLVIGDVLLSMNPVTQIRGLSEPRRKLTPDPAQNRRSAKQKLGSLEPALVLFGHGPPLRDTRKFVEFVGRLPD